MHYCTIMVRGSSFWIRLFFCLKLIICLRLLALGSTTTARASAAECAHMHL